MLIANIKKKVEERLYCNPTFGPLLPVASKGLALALSPPRITSGDRIHPLKEDPTPYLLAHEERASGGLLM